MLGCAEFRITAGFTPRGTTPEPFERLRVSSVFVLFTSKQAVLTEPAIKSKIA